MSKMPSLTVKIIRFKGDPNKQRAILLVITTFKYFKQCNSFIIFIIIDKTYSYSLTDSFEMTR